ncbi:MAG TPA: diacylglycerol kinase family protein [Gemmatimonadaceae bacterium]
MNSRAGSAAAARAALENVGGFEVHDVRPAMLAAEVRRAIEGGARRILVAGGDGTIGSAASALAGTKVELAILPGGTLNHLAKDLKLPLDLERAARVAHHGRAVSVDSAVVNDRIFLNTSSVGAYVSFVRLRERLERRLGYGVASVVAGFRLLVRMPTFRVTVQLEGKARDYITPLVFIGVGERELKLPTLGARIENGRRGLHVMVVRQRSGGRALALGMAAAARGVHAVAQTPALDAFVVDECTVQPHVPRIAVDGEIVSATSPLVYRHVSGRLRVVAPVEEAERMSAEFNK